MTIFEARDLAASLTSHSLPRQNHPEQGFPVCEVQERRSFEHLHAIGSRQFRVYIHEVEVDVANDHPQQSFVGHAQDEYQVGQIRGRDPDHWQTNESEVFMSVAFAH